MCCVLNTFFLPIVLVVNMLLREAMITFLLIVCFFCCFSHVFFLVYFSFCLSVYPIFVPTLNNNNCAIFMNSSHRSTNLWTIQTVLCLVATETGHWSHKVSMLE